MRSQARITATVLIAAGTLVGLADGAFAQTQHILHHRYGGRYMSTASAAPIVPTTASFASQIGPRDDDGSNARNPALPAYQRGMGQETGGPARMLIPE